MKKFIVLGLIILVVIGIIFLFNILNSSSKSLSQAEKETAIAKILGRKPNLTDDAPKGDAQYKGKYTSFKYPAKAKIYTYRDPNTAKNTSIIESFSFDIDNPRLILNFSVMENASDLKDIKDISGVKFREDKSTGYQESEIIIKDQKGLIFSKNAGLAEKTGFFFVNNKIYSFAVTGSSYKEVYSLFDNIIRSLVFIK